MARTIFLSVILMCVCSAVRAQTQQEFWPEVDVFVPITPKVRLIFSATITRVQETRANTEGQVGASIDFRAKEFLSFRAGYRYGFALKGGDPYEEHRIILDQTFRRNLPLKVLLSDRNRVDLRFVNGEFSARYRNRATFEREFTIRRVRVTPYVSGEVFYDSRFDTWNRNRLTVGVQVPLNGGLPIIKHLHPNRLMTLDFYIMRQNDSRSNPARVRGYGLTFNLYL